MNGYVIDGRVHAHVTLADSRRAFGGHLEPGTTVFTFAIVTLSVLGDATNFDRLDDRRIVDTKSQEDGANARLIDYRRLRSYSPWADR